MPCMYHISYPSAGTGHPACTCTDQLTLDEALNDDHERAERESYQTVTDDEAAAMNELCPCCGADMGGSDHCPACGCEAYESYCCPMCPGTMQPGQRQCNWCAIGG